MVETGALEAPMREMTPEAMETLSAEVRRLRTLLQQDLTAQLEAQFRLAVPVGKAALDQRTATLRRRFEAWIAERARARVAREGGAHDDAQVAVRTEAITEVASRTLLRLVLLRQLEATGVSRPVLTGGWGSKGYLEFRAFAPDLARDEYEGFAYLLQLITDDLGVELPGLYGEALLDRYFALSPAALREVVSVLNRPELDTAWQDDTALGWVYQFWNDPQREAIDERVGPRGRVSAHEIASKTQLFTERYMVDWLLQNSLGRIATTIRRGRDGARTWPFFVDEAPQLDPDAAPKRVADLKLLDPACGSGHFLAGAFDLLASLYREEARATGVDRSDAEIAEGILRDNLHGIDIDARAVQVAAAVLYLKARRLARDAKIPPMNLVATAFDLDALGAEDPAISALAKALPGDRNALDALLKQLHNVSFRGSLIRFESEGTVGLPAIDDVEQLLSRHVTADDLGVRFDGTQLNAGLRLRTLLSEGRYDVVAFNPPYLATSKIDLPGEELALAFGGAPDIFAAFVDRAFELCKPTGLIAFVALSNWMFLSTYESVRERMLQGHIVALVDLGKGAFRRASKLIQTAMVVASPTPLRDAPSLGGRVGSRDAISASQVSDLTQALTDPAVYRPFDPRAFAAIEGAPLLFWLDPNFMQRYAALPKIAEVATGTGGIATTNNERFLRAIWEIRPEEARAAFADAPGARYMPYLKGAEGREWIEPYRWVLRSSRRALELRVLVPNVRVERPAELGVAYTTIGQRFGTRLHSVTSVRDVSGASVFPSARASVEAIVCALNRSDVRELASAFNPTVNFQLGDVRRLPFDAVEGADEIVHVLRQEFLEFERACELSIEYRGPAPDAWEPAQRWAQLAVDRPKGAPLPECQFVRSGPPAAAHISHAVGLALGRFPTPCADPLPGGILFLSPVRTSLDHPACAAIHEAWSRTPDGGGDLAAYLRTTFFDEHKRVYENRPIYFALSSTKRNFVALVSIHRWNASTLSLLLADHLVPAKTRLEGELGDLRTAAATDQSAPNRRRSEKRFAELQKILEELQDFTAKVEEIAERGPPTSDGKTTPRERDARFVMDLDDGVMVNSAALWPLLEPAWKDPRKWWKLLANADGKKDYDWSHVAARYFPDRVRAKCRDDASLAVAHGCFWELHPQKAYAWELRLQNEIREDFTIDEADSDERRKQFLTERGDAAREIEVAERKRRERKAAKQEAEADAEPRDADEDEGEGREA